MSRVPGRMPGPSSISAEDVQIEQMCRAAYAVEEPGMSDLTGLEAPAWDDLPEGSRHWWRIRMRAALEVIPQR